MRTRAYKLEELSIPLDPLKAYAGREVLCAILTWAHQAIGAMHAESNGFPVALLGRLRGNRRGIHFGDLVKRLEAEHLVSMESPFEGSNKVSGAVWIAREILGMSAGLDASLAKLCWEAHATDLPMHVHEHSDRCIIVHEGRGFFHVTNETFEGFSGKCVRSIPARERDVFLFSRGVVHTFSTAESPMTLLSCQLPYLPFDHPDQYRLPNVRWTAADHQDSYSAKIASDPNWHVLAEVPTKAPGKVGLQHLVG